MAGKETLIEARKRSSRAMKVSTLLPEATGLTTTGSRQQLKLRWLRRW